ncbi:hypothetical protein Lalb_Chr20g0118601 [Lupinus albus]|uniref:Uncharacterized protein n=1 Tax=Lupinus albus TaxID=3870 RepID=A0A6A4NPN9_LUPAL|nr:hypothetical protein Lalb_Chr20g0118601 [Lupinus albus]
MDIYCSYWCYCTSFCHSLTLFCALILADSGSYELRKGSFLVQSEELNQIKVLCCHSYCAGNKNDYILLTI